jgi:hypothetical protein
MSDPPSETLWAWITETPDGEASMIGMLTEFGHTPMITVRESLARGLLRGLAIEHHETSGQPVWLVQYRAEAVLEQFPPTEERKAT